MSNTTSLHCKECKESLWTGQRRYINCKRDFLALFLYRHMGHHLVFAIDGCHEEYDLYTDFEDLAEKERDPDNCFVDGEYNYDHD